MSGKASKPHPDDRVMSIIDVAQRAGVSAATVSRVLNGKDRVAPETKRRVESAAEELNYRPNRQARALTLRRTNTIGLVLPDLFGEYFGELMRGIDQAAREANVHVLITRAVSAEEERRVVEDLIGGGAVDGLIFLVSQLDDDSLPRLASLRRSLVVLDRDVGDLDMDNVLVDNRSAGREATMHLLKEAGARQLYFVGGPEANVDTRDRLAGFYDACREVGIEVPPEDVHFTDYSYDNGLQIAKDVVRRMRLRRGQRAGFIAANDNLACGILEALCQEGIPVPSRAVVVGFDDTELARVSRPALTSMRVPLQEVGRTCVRLLLDRLAGRRDEAAKVFFKARLVRRTSSIGHVMEEPCGETPTATVETIQPQAADPAS